MIGASFASIVFGGLGPACGTQRTTGRRDATTAKAFDAKMASRSP